ncbi:MFS general substrate transporter [Meredithblackwellia eburnea MCA 4105]
MAQDSRNRPPYTCESFTSAGKEEVSLSGWLSATPTMVDQERGTGVSSTRMEGSAPLNHVRSNEIGVTESMLADAGRSVGRRIAESSTTDIEAGKQEREGDGADGSKEDSLAAPPGWDYPGDRGDLRSWGVVFGVFVLACCQMGYGLVWGVFSQKLHETTHKDTPFSVLNLVVGVANFLMNGSSFIGGRLGEVYGFKRMIAIGIACTFISLLISSFVSHSLPLLFIFQGVAVGVSQGLGMPLFLSISSQHFLKRRGLATGLAVSGAGWGGAIGSLLVRAMMPKLGYSHTLLSYACINLAVSVGAWFLLQVRPPPPTTSQEKDSGRWLPEGMFRDPATYSLALTLFIGVFGYLTLYYYIVTYTTITCPQLDPKSLLPALPLIVANLFSGFGRIAAGMVADTLGPCHAIFVSFFVGGILQATIWPYAKTYTSIMILAALYGFVGSWFITLLPVVCAQLFGVRGLATITGFAVMVGSPGQLLGATLAGTVLSSTGGYNGVAYYAGGVMIAGSLCILVARFHRQKKLWAKPTDFAGVRKSLPELPGLLSITPQIRFLCW